MTVRMTHPDLPEGQEIHVLPEAVDGNRRSGWRTDDDLAHEHAATEHTKPVAADTAAARRATAPSGSQGKG